MPTTDDYLALIPPTNAEQPKFMATVAALVDPLAQLQAFTASLPQAFDLDTAVGAQLDAVGVRVGISRIIGVPLEGVYFSFDLGGLGFDQGSWQGPFDPNSGITSLSDDAYRLLIRAKIAANQWDGTTPSAQAILSTLFAHDGTFIFIQDNQDMSMVMGVSGIIPDAVSQALILGGFISLKPEGVHVDYIVVTDDGPMFGFDVDNQYIGGFDHGSWGFAGPVGQLDAGASFFISTYGAELALLISQSLHQTVTVDMPAAMGA